MHQVLLTGASSLLGNALARQLSAAGYEVHLLIRQQTDVSKLPKFVPEDRRHVIDGGHATVVEAIHRSNPDCVFHLAGWYLRQPEIGEVDPLIDANLRLGIQLLEGMRTLSRSPVLINFGTYSQYYDFTGPRPLDLYSALKQAFAGLLDFYKDAYGLRYMSLILYDTYGPGDRRLKLVNALKQAVLEGTPLPLSDPDIVMDIIHIDDAAAAAVHAAESLLSGSTDLDGGVFSVSGERLSIRDLVEVFCEVAGTKIDAQWGTYPLPERRIMEPYLGEILPGWRPKIALRSGLVALLGTSGI
jgi:nucleoside-diphosphate-sugar epimerase